MSRPITQMPWVKSYRKIRAAAFFVRRVHRRVRTLLKMRTDVRHQVSAGRKAEDSNFVRIDMPLLGVKANQSYRSLRVFKRHRRFRIDLVLDLWVAMRPRTWHPVLEQYAGYPLGGQPIAHLSTFKINGQMGVTPSWKDDDRHARMAEISENLHRAELTALEEAEQVTEWIRLVEELRQEISAQSAQKSGPGRPAGGLSAAAREIGVNRDAARRAQKIAALPTEAKAAARELGLSDGAAQALA